MAALGLYCHTAFSSHCLRAYHCSGFSCFEAQALKHRLQNLQLKGSPVQQHMGMWDLPRPGIEFIHFSALARRFLTLDHQGITTCNFIGTFFVLRFHIFLKLFNSFWNICSGEFLGIDVWEAELPTHMWGKRRKITLCRFLNTIIECQRLNKYQNSFPHGEIYLP